MDNTKLTAIIVDDDAANGESLQAMIERYEISAKHFLYPMQAISYVASHPIDMAFIDLRMPTIDGIEVLKQLKQRNPEMVCVLMSGFATIDAAVEAMRHGAYDFLIKPIRRNYLTLQLQKITEKIALSKEIAALRSKISQQATAKLIGQSPSMGELRKRINRIAKSNATVLILGESGTGKELVIDALHEGSPRRGKPLIKINCGAIPPNLVEAELFGFEKGAFTGATQMKMGQFEMAEGGTLFLDEIGELPHDVQVKILRVLQDHTIQRIGGTQSRKVDVRIVSATNKDLYKAIQEGQFREDLFYRLNVIPIHVPPLRERTEDIPLLTRYFLDQCCKRYSKAEKWLTSSALSHLIQYNWPGNVRELQHLCEQMVLTCESQWLSEKALPDIILGAKHRPMSIQIEIGMTMHQASTLIIKETLNYTGGEIDKAARMLNIHPKTIRRRLKEEVGDDPTPLPENN